MAKFRTVLDGESRRLELDGHNIAGQVTGFVLAGQARGVPQLTLDLIPGDLAVDFPDVDVELDPHSRALLIRLGWTPPA